MHTTKGVNKIDTAMLRQYGVWRRGLKEEALKTAGIDTSKLTPEELLAGRTLDLNVLALNHVLDWCVVHKWLTAKPSLDWTKLAETPEECRLLTAKEVDELACATLVTQAAVNALPKRQQHLRQAQVKRTKLFKWFIYFLFRTGAREQESLLQRWEHVTWSKRGVPGYVFFPRRNAKAGGGRPAKDRNVDMHDALEELLKGNLTNLISPGLACASM